MHLSSFNWGNAIGHAAEASVVECIRCCARKGILETLARDF